MSEEVEIRYLIETSNGVYSTYNFTVKDGLVQFYEFGEEYKISTDNVVKITKEVVQAIDITSEVMTEEKEKILA